MFKLSNSESLKTKPFCTIIANVCDTSKTLSDIRINMKRKKHYPKISAICLCSSNKGITSVTNTND